MNLKDAILKSLGRDKLREMVDGFGIEGVDRRSKGEMIGALSRSQEATPKDMLQYLSKSELKEVCRQCGVSPTGRRGAMMESLLQTRDQRHSASGAKCQESTPQDIESVDKKTPGIEPPPHVGEPAPVVQEPVRSVSEVPPGMMRVTKTELVWPGKYNDDGTLKEVARVNLPFQVIETVNESRATREIMKSPRNLSLFDVYEGKEGDTFED